MELPEILSDSPFGPDKLYLSVRAYVLLLQAFFSAWDRFKWDHDAKLTKIIITRTLPHVPKDETKLPVIAVAGGDASWRGGAPNQNLHGDLFHQGMPRVHSGVVNSGAAIYCIAQNDVEASLLGWNVFNLIPTMREEAKRLGGMDYIDSLPVLSSVFDAAGIVRGATTGQWWATRVTSSYSVGQENVIGHSTVLQNAVDQVRILTGPNRVHGA